MTSRWDTIYSERLAAGEQALSGDPALIVTAHEDLLPRTGRAVDVAAGLGKNAGWLARRGLDVLAVDASPVALGAIALAADVDQLPIQTEVRDIETEGLGLRQFDVVLITYFLDRPLLHALSQHLVPGGMALFAQPTVTNLDRNQGPSARFSLDGGEIDALARTSKEAGLKVITATASWRANNVHEAWLVVRS